MIKKTITYKDFDGNSRTDDFYFHMSKPELIEMNFGPEGGMQAYIERIIKADDRGRLLAIFKDLILKSYGEKSLDGIRFIKSSEKSEAFSQTNAYEVLYLELIGNDKAAAEFINNVVPADLAEEVAKMQADKSNSEMKAIN